MLWRRRRSSRTKKGKYMADDKPTVARQVYFFRVEHFQTLKNELPGALQKIENLPFSDEGRYLVEPRAEARLCVFPDSLEYPLRMRFGRTRRDHLPDIEKGGKLEALELAENAGLIDLGHLIIFDDGHIAAEWNPDGPKLKRLSAYLIQKGGLRDNVKIRNLFQRNIVDVVSKLATVRILDIDIPPSAIELAREADADFAGAISASEKMGATKKVGLTLTADQGSHKLRSLALKLATIIHLRPQEKSQFYTLKATGYDEAGKVSRFVDILESKLVTGEIFPKKGKRSRGLDSEEAYRLIHRSYIEMKPRLAEAATSGDL